MENTSTMPSLYQTLRVKQDIITCKAMGTRLVIVKAYQPDDAEIVLTRDYPGRIIRGILVEGNILVFLFDSSAVIPTCHG